MNTQLEVRESKRYTVVMGLTYAFIIGFGICFWQGMLLFRSITPESIFFGVGQCVSVLYLIWVWIPLFDRRPYLTLTPEGIWMRSRANPFQKPRLIPWDTLYFFHFYTQKRRNVGTDYIAFRQKDAENDINLDISGADTHIDLIAQVLNEYAAVYHFYDLGYDLRKQD